MIWAIVSKGGETSIRFDNPETTERYAARRGRKIWKIRRNLQYGERVDFQTGKIIFDLETIADAMIAEIKAEAGRRILTAAPLWRQLNDRDEPEGAGAIARRAEVLSIREWSNKLEKRLLGAKTAAKIVAIRKEIEERK